MSHQLSMVPIVEQKQRLFLCGGKVTLGQMDLPEFKLSLCNPGYVSAPTRKASSVIFGSWEAKRLQDGKNKTSCPNVTLLLEDDGELSQTSFSVSSQKH